MEEVVAIAMPMPVQPDSAIIVWLPATQSIQHKPFPDGSMYFCTISIEGVEALLARDRLQ
jgi:hypothetical protein